MSFEIGDEVFLRISPTKGIMRSGQKGKLSPRLVGPFKIQEWIGETTYKLDLPRSYAHLHNVFHVSMLRKYIPNESHVIETETPKILEDLSYEKKAMEIVERREHQLQRRSIPMVKIH